MTTFLRSIVGKIPYPAYRIEKINHKVNDDTMSIDIILLLTDEDSKNKIDYTVEIPVGVNRVVLGKEREVIWVRDL